MALKFVERVTVNGLLAGVYDTFEEAEAARMQLLVRYGVKALHTSEPVLDSLFD